MILRKLRIGVIDLVAKGPTRALFARVMNANFAAIMPQVIATWCEQEGHDVTLVCYTGFENVVKYFDYVLGFTDRAVVSEVLADCSQHRPSGIRMAAKQQPAVLPGVRERWK